MLTISTRSFQKGANVPVLASIINCFSRESSFFFDPYLEATFLVLFPLHFFFLTTITRASCSSNQFNFISLCFSPLPRFGLHEHLLYRSGKSSSTILLHSMHYDTIYSNLFHFIPMYCTLKPNQVATQPPNANSKTLKIRNSSSPKCSSLLARDDAHALKTSRSKLRLAAVGPAGQLPMWARGGCGCLKETKRKD